MDGNKFQPKNNKIPLRCSKLLEFASLDDLSAFVLEVEGKGIDVDEVGFWYGRNSSSKMGFDERTPLMIASIYGSSRVLKYLISTKKVNVNKSSGSDRVTALQCAAAGGSVMSVEVVRLLIDAGADVTVTDANGNKPGDVIARGINSSIRKGLEMLLKGFVIEDIVSTKKEYPVDVQLLDINNELYGSDEFRMYTFKVKPCSRAYTHDWTECPFVHPGENARRRDLNKYSYTCVPCPEFRKGSCGQGDACEYAHGVFESWLHPAQYKTRLCKDEIGCARKICFFAHKAEELRPVYASTGSAIPSPKSESLSTTHIGLMSPSSGSSQNSSPMTHTSTPPMSPSISSVNGWQNKMNHLQPPVLQLSSSRLRTSLNARDIRQQMIDEMSSNLYANRFNELNHYDGFGSYDQSLLSSMQSPNTASHHQVNYSSPLRKSVISSRSGAFSKQRSQSFINRDVGAQFSQWGSPDAKVDWGFNVDQDQANYKLTKSASFGFRNGVPVNVGHEPDVSWVNTLVKDVSPEKLPLWVDQMFIEQERLVA
ncbi:zinc finger CCCH domain-containing protein 29-like [Rutidosis leptorrhynchoides]|uniref:zinc finger CCCH domain-containing protein 29-like n=1 Tax=Rutidosis leptorrhynchoides TaxID=125765 RepID=UPI003A995FCC